MSVDVVGVEIFKEDVVVSYLSPYDVFAPVEGVQGLP
jgi:hypothetical protein